MSILMAFLSRCSPVEHVDIQYVVSFSLNDFELLLRVQRIVQLKHAVE
jgi:hypothetical protein